MVDHEIEAMTIDEPDTPAGRIEAHGELLRQGEAAHARAWMEATASKDAADLGPLMRVATVARAALAPVTPDAAFRERLQRDLVAAARRAQPSRAARWAVAMRRRRVRRLVRSGAAVAVIGITAAVLWRGRPAAAVGS